MTIRNARTFMDNLWDWEILDGCFGKTTMGVSDLDGIIERHGQFLVLETKSTGKSIPIGQVRIFEAMARMKNFTVLVVWGDPGYPNRMQEWPHKPHEADRSTLQQAVRDWYELVEYHHNRH